MSIINNKENIVSSNKPNSVILEEINELKNKQKHTDSKIQQLKYEIEINNLRSKLKNQ